MANTSTVTQTTSRKPQTSMVHAILLSTYLEQNFNGDVMKLAAETKIKPYQIRKWLNNDAVLADGKIYLKASKIRETAAETRARLKALKSDDGAHAEPFNVMLKRDFDKNQSRFAKEYGVHQQQVNRWTKRDCLFFHDQVYRMQRPLFEDVSSNKVAH